MGIETSINTYLANNWLGNYDVNNIVAKIDGLKNRPYILIMAHYDSTIEDLHYEASNSTGAADDGYGVVTLLQIAEYFSKSKKPLKNGIKFLLTDSEETGPLEGSKAEISQNPEYYENVSFIINIEARGLQGPVMMFETSGGNSKVIDLFSKTNYPFSNSLMTTLFHLMPNFTDLSPFMEKGYQGLNFSTLGQLKNYHSGNDHYENIDLDTLQHYGEQILPIVKEFVYSDTYSNISYFESDNNAIFFTLLPNIFISYNDFVNILIFITTLLFTIACFIMGSSKKKLIIKVCAKYAFLWFGFSILAAILALVITLIISFIQGVEFNPVFMYELKYDTFLFIIYIFLILILSFVWVKHFIDKSNSLIEMILGGIIMNLVMFVICFFVCKGCTYLFIIPSLSASISTFMYNCFSRKLAQLVLLIPIIFIVLIYTPILYILYYGLTIGSLFICALSVSIGISIFTPAVMMISYNRHISMSLKMNNNCKDACPRNSANN
jgi:hypothetical protein